MNDECSGCWIPETTEMNEYPGAKLGRKGVKQGTEKIGGG